MHAYKPNSRRRGSLQKVISGIDNAPEIDYMYDPFHKRREIFLVLVYLGRDLVIEHRRFEKKRYAGSRAVSYMLNTHIYILTCKQRIFT